VDVISNISLKEFEFGINMEIVSTCVHNRRVKLMAKCEYMLRNCPQQESKMTGKMRIFTKNGRCDCAPDVVCKYSDLRGEKNGRL
jgi:hypothetical protein